MAAIAQGHVVRRDRSDPQCDVGESSGGRRVQFAREEQTESGGPGGKDRDCDKSATTHCAYVSERDVSALIHATYFSRPEDAESASNSGTLYGCRSAKACSNA
jgi:hypothetical protein